ncbi:discoidin domain-containing protein [Actinocatenispora comari]|uniref:Mycodextranase n=1 Tax=Actinocatenispora comari TaxID=2807577 RepID=A0A8J4EM69_9ACTN|nr:discoidin domain-containing protein [Actinocatenispora comari]GIL30052.1 mycodextranase [Actinocatenispora comari]
MSRISPHHPRTVLPRLGTGLAALGLAALGLAVPAGPVAAHPQHRPLRAAADAPAGVGADVPFTEYEAEAAHTTGTVVGPDLTQGTVASEASGREAVQLAAGQYVQFTLTAAANAVDVSYHLARGAAGTLSVYVGDGKVGTLSLDAKYTYLDTGNIAGSTTHHFFDDARLLLGTTAAAGDTVRLQVDGGDVPATVDVADFEDVPDPIAQPAGSISVTDAPYHADPAGAADATGAIDQALADARSQGRSVYLPKGTYRTTGPLQANGLTLTGAGPWYSVLHGSHLIDASNSSGATTLSHFAAIGEITTRSGSSANSFVNGSLGAGSAISDVWIQHQEVGIWLMGPGNSNLTIEHNRILDNTADGINFNGTVTGSTVRDNFLRNTGDDGIALWSLYAADAHDTITHNTVIQPNLANGIALYGGTDLTVSDNLVADTNALGSGIAVSNQQFIAGQGFSPLSGTIALAGNYLLRTGALNPNWHHPMSAIRFDAYDYPIDADVRLTDTRIVDSPYSAIEVVGGAGDGKQVTGLTVRDTTVSNVGTVVLQAETGGSGTFTGVTATGVGVDGIYDCPYPASGSTFAITDGGGNSGWDTTWGDCSTWPQPGDDGGNPPPADGNLAAGRPVTASGHQDVYVPANAVDGDANSYWESTDDAFPQWLQVDLGSATTVSRIVLTLPPSAAWQARTETLSVTGSTDGSSFHGVVGAAGYRFDPATGNQVTIPVDPASVRFLRLTFTANTGWPAGQVSEFEVYAG